MICPECDGEMITVDECRGYFFSGVFYTLECKDCGYSEDYEPDYDCDDR